MPSDLITIPVNIPGTRYEIFVQPGLLQRCGPIIQKLTNARKVAIVTDTNLQRLQLPLLQDSLEKAGIGVEVASIPPGEEYKTLEQIGLVFNQLLKKRMDRMTPIVALGGGVIGDMAGFVAATILRGVPFIQIPTSLLAMVDASVGGKTGINHPEGKNLIGAFHQPWAVLIDPETLKSLPAGELRGGLAECIKHDIIRDADGFKDLEKNIGRAMDLDIDYLTQLIAHNVQIKASVVEKDPTEQGERAHLNFGHTFGHAIESSTRYAYSHGESVALGMCAASHLAMRRNLISDADRQRIVNLIDKAALPTRSSAFDIPQTMHAMTSDKKVKDGKLRFILPDRIGHVNVYNDIENAEVEAALLSLRG